MTLLLLASCGRGAHDCAFVDLDGDGFGGVQDCSPVPGTLLADRGGDCDDADPSRFPDAPESCDDVDEDCDGRVDEGATDRGFVDLDQDSWGADPVEGCDADAVARSGDCDDTDASAHPDAVEACDDVDQDCDGSVDEGLPDEFYLDEDGDGYGDGLVETCVEAPDLVEDGGDCDDGDLEVHPDAAEACANGVDDDCDGLLDCEDADCVGHGGCDEICDDDLDNNGDGDTDCDDVSCLEACYGHGTVWVTDGRFEFWQGTVSAETYRHTMGEVAIRSIRGWVRFEGLETKTCHWRVDGVWTSRMSYWGSSGGSISTTTDALFARGTEAVGADCAGLDRWLPPEVEFEGGVGGWYGEKLWYVFGPPTHIRSESDAGSVFRSSSGPLQLGSTLTFTPF